MKNQSLGNDKHESVPPHTVIDEMCSEDTDVNIHLQDKTGESHLEIRGQIIPNSDFCE
jgi:hypothetical protein